jgi:transaldolase
MEAYLSGLEKAEGDLSQVSSVASFFISRVDVAVDAELDAIGTAEAMELRGKVAVANGVLAYEAFRATFTGPRWDALVARGAKYQRPLWASTSTKDPSFPDTLYVDALIGPHTVNTIPDSTLEAFVDHGTVSRTIDDDVAGAHAVIDGLAALGIDLEAITDELEAVGVASFEGSFDTLLDSLTAKAATF